MPAMRGISTQPSFASTLASSAMVAALAACQPELPPISWEGKMISFAANDPEAVCGGTLEWMDARAIAMKGVFGEGTYDALEYYWVPDLWWEQPWCREPAAGCADEDRVYSEYVPHEHELAHALRRDGLPAVFEEGLASVFGDMGWAREAAPRERLAEMLETSSIAGHADYSRAGHFVAFLIETYGLDPLGRLAELGARRDSYSKVSEDFEEAFGVSLDQALIDYADFPECDPVAWMSKDIACALPAIPLAPSFDADAELLLDIDCGASDVQGPISNFMFTETTLDIHQQIAGLPLWLELKGDIGPETSALLFSCGGCSDSTVIWLTDGRPVEQLFLPAGRYVLRMFRPVDDPGQLGISLSH